MPYFAMAPTQLYCTLMCKIVELRLTVDTTSDM